MVPLPCPCIQRAPTFQVRTRRIAFQKPVPRLLLRTGDSRERRLTRLATGFYERLGNHPARMARHLSHPCSRQTSQAQRAEHLRPRRTDPSKEPIHRRPGSAVAALHYLSGGPIHPSLAEAVSHNLLSTIGFLCAGAASSPRGRPTDMCLATGWRFLKCTPFPKRSNRRPGLDCLLRPIRDVILRFQQHLGPLVPILSVPDHQMVPGADDRHVLTQSRPR